MSRSPLSLVSIGLALAFAGCGSSVAPPLGAWSLGNAVDNVAQTVMQQQGMPGVTVGLAKNGTMLYVQGYGVSDLTAHQATPPSAIFEVGSVTKQFRCSSTAVLLWWCSPTTKTRTPMPWSST
jgi:CubicO group peptidase (beta-lactamase class C family)